MTAPAQLLCIIRDAVVPEEEGQGWREGRQAGPGRTLWQAGQDRWTGHLRAGSGGGPGCMMGHWGGKQGRTGAGWLEQNGSSE